MKYTILNRNMLKIIALITMVVDHTGMLFFPELSGFRIVGRLSFPIIAFLLVEGCMHTKNFPAYLARLGIFAIISEIPFDLCTNGSFVNFGAQNIMFTLFIGAVLIYIDMRCTMKTAITGTNAGIEFIKIVSLAAGMLLAWFIRCDYSVFGILMIYGFYIFRGRKILQLVFVAAVNIATAGLQAYGTLAMIPISMYNGEKGKVYMGEKSYKYFFYIFYPAHMLLLAVLYKLVQ